MTGYAPIGAFFVVGVLYGSLLTLGLSYLVRPHDPYSEKRTTYECGIEPIGHSWSQFNIRYYLFALVFVVFDVETVFLYPWARVFRTLTSVTIVPGMGTFVLGEMMVFLAILVVGYAYAWRKGALEWI